jgi:hypothetical protein
LELPKSKGFSSNKICIGTDGCGNDSYISLDETDTNVYFLDHESWAEDVGLIYDYDKNEYNFDFENDDIDWSILISSKNLTDHVVYFINMLQDMEE